MRRTRLAILRVFDKIYWGDPSGCWIWTGALNRYGYGMVGLGRRSDGTALVHRVVYEWEIGPIPDGLDLDHLCRVRRCCNPEHLEPVTRQVNVDRGLGHKGHRKTQLQGSKP